MDRQLVPPVRLEPVTAPYALRPSEAHGALQNYLASLPPTSTSRSQLERLVDSLGVDLGLIQPDESSRREEQRRAVRAEKRAERREAREAAAMEGVEAEVEGLEGGADEKEEAPEEGAVGFEGEEGMQERGDVEYGDEESADGDEPDEAEEGQEKMDVDMDA
jgi:hypothetical protein